jgi:hypothetical protein
VRLVQDGSRLPDEKRRSSSGVSLAVALPRKPTGRVDVVDEVLAAYFAAWNETDEGERRQLLERSITDEAQLLDSTGDWRGVDGFAERISRYHALAPGSLRRSR